MNKRNPILKSLFAFSLVLLSTSLMAQVKSITGKVTDFNNAAIPGVTVVEKGTTNGIVTNGDGIYELRISSENAILTFSYIGMKAQEIAVNGQSKINVVLTEESIDMEELVVVGYGVQKKVNLTGAVASVDGESVAKKASADVLSALQGEMPGVAVLRSSGQPGSETSGLRIRGFSSVNESSSLVLIDGVEGDMTMINPNDVESISVLKDAAASAIYGARAAGGVVLITTKSGSDGKAKISYNGYFGINTPGIMPERVTAWEEQDMINVSRLNASGKVEWNEEQTSWVANPNFNYRPNNTNGRWDYFSATNWVDEGTKDFTTQQNHSVSITGGNKGTNYAVSAGYYTKNGILAYGPDKYDRYNIRAKLNSEVNKYISFGVQVSYAGGFTETNPYGVTNILERLYRIRQRQPIYTPEEDINDSEYNGDLQVNPIDLMKNGGITKKKNETYMGKGSLTIKNIVPGLSLDLNASRKISNNDTDTQRRYLVWYDRLGTTVRFSANNPNSLNKKRTGDTHDNLEALLNYKLDLGKHKFNVLGGISYESYRSDEVSITIKNLNSDDFPSLNYYDNSLVDNTAVSDYIGTWAIASQFGRLNYNFADRYIFEANVRHDGSSRLSPEYRWDIFPSFSAAWRINEESWFDVDKVSNLKIRASWGQLGNSAVLGLYDYMPLILSGTHLGESYYYQNELASQSKTWETVETTNIGIDLGLFDSRLNISGDYYWKFNKNMLSRLQYPSLIGVGTPVANVGELKTWGWEFEARWQDKIGDFSYQAAFNISDSQNKLIKYDGVNVVSAGTVALLEGYSLNTIWGYKTDGYWSSREEYLAYKEANPGYETFNDASIASGDVKYIAQGTADHIIGAGSGTPEDSGDLVCLGSSNGRYLFGLNLAAQWKGFDFSMFFQGIGKRSFLIQTSTITPFYQTSTMPWTIHRDYWTEENTDAEWPRMYNNNGNDFNFKPSDKWVQNGAYIRLKNIQLGYTLPINKKIIEKARVYISGDDVWEYSNVMPVFDPEVGNNASATYYPFFRTWSVGLNVTF